MKSLLILRHAEATPAIPELSDVHRPLAERGRTQARDLGMWLRDRAIAPDRILCSAAVRARETADIVTAAAKWTAQVTANDALYNASGEDLLAQARSASDDVTRILLVSHAPGVSDLVGLLITKQGDATLVYGSATLAEVVLDIEHWSQIGHGTGALRLLLPP